MKTLLIIAAIISILGITIQIFDMDKLPFNPRGMIITTCGIILSFILIIIQKVVC